MPNDYGHTPLHLAVMSGNAIVTRMLVIAGVSLGVRDRLGETPLHKATLSRDIECIKALLAPVPEKPRKLSSVLEQKNYRGELHSHCYLSWNIDLPFVKTSLIVLIDGAHDVT